MTFNWLAQDNKAITYKSNLETIPKYIPFSLMSVEVFHNKKQIKPPIWADISWHTTELHLIATSNLLTQVLDQKSLLTVILKHTQKNVYL